MEVDDMFDLMKSLDGAKPVGANKSTPVKEKNKDTGGAKYKSNQRQKPKENRNVKEKDTYLEKTIKNKDVNNMIDKTSSLTGAKPKNTVWRTKNDKDGVNIHLEDKLSSGNNCVDDMFDIITSLNVEKPKVTDQNKRTKYKKEENVIAINSESVNKALEHLNHNFFAPKTLSLSRLKELCKEDISEAIFTLVDKKSGFLDIFHVKSLGSEEIFCIMNLLGKLCNSEDLRFNETILSPACSHEFLQNLQELIGGIPVKDITDIKQQVGQFFEDVLSFVKTVCMVFPMTASHRMKKVFLSTIITIQHIQEHKTDVNISEHVCAELKSLWDELDSQNVSYNNTSNAGDKSKYFYNTSFKDPETNVKQANVINVKPPNYFRAISVYPTQKDLFSNESFLRENIVVGAYADVEHYLDVQFRLYKEDLVSPLREGLQEYLKNASSLDQTKRINNIRYYSNVRFLGSEINRGNFGCIVKFSKAKFKHIAWNNSKRLMCGSLLLFSNNDFKSFFLATVSSRDVKKLKQGIITVRFCSSCDVPADLFFDDFVMLESEVFFEPYYQVLTVLKKISRYSFPMEDYIINVSSEPSIPGKKTKKDEDDHKWYLTIGKKRFNVFDSDSWPSHVDLGLDCSQYRAFKAALTSSFSVIQGPPGTGKTYIGLKIARALLDKRVGPILIVCYTNHALDQFLEGLLPFTRRLVRIGGQSKSELVQKFNITEYRRRLIKQRKEMKDNLSKKGRKSYYFSYEAMVQRKYFAAKCEVDDIMYEMLELENKITALRTSILSTVNFKQHFNRAQKRMLSDRVLVDWLTEELDFSNISHGGINVNTETEENVINLDELGSTKSESSTDIEETDESDSEISSDDSYPDSDFFDPNEDLDFDDDPELVSYFSRKRPIKYEKRKSFFDSWKTRFIENKLKQLEEVDDGLIKLNFESKLVNIDKLIAGLTDAKSKLNETNCNKNWKRIQCVRYEILDELNAQQKYLDQLEIEVLENLDLDELKEEIDDKLEELLNSVRSKMLIEIDTKKKYIAEKLSSKPDFNSDVIEKFTDCSNIWMVSPNDRWMLYHYWKNMYRQKLMDDYSVHLENYEWEYRNFKEASQRLDEDILRTMDVIGLTTTSAARNHTLLENIGPKIVIVEEAAEVFEAHIVTTLTHSCEQVVLIVHNNYVVRYELRVTTNSKLQ